jgi:hypothetical protein
MMQSNCFYYVIPHFLLDMCATKIQQSQFVTFCQVYAYDLMHTFDLSNICTTQNALQLPFQRNAARQMQHSIGNECTSGVPKRNDAVGVFKA